MRWFQSAPAPAPCGVCGERDVERWWERVCDECAARMDSGNVWAEAYERAERDAHEALLDMMGEAYERLYLERSSD